MEEVTFDLGFDGSIGALLKEKAGRSFWAEDPQVPRDGGLREHGVGGVSGPRCLEHGVYRSKCGDGGSDDDDDPTDVR